MSKFVLKVFLQESFSNGSLYNSPSEDQNFSEYLISADNKYGIEQLAAQHNFIDTDRVGIYGHSGGGFMSTAALFTYPYFYDVAVSSAGNHDNNICNIWWSEVHNGVQKVTAKVEPDSAGADSIKTE